MVNQRFPSGPEVLKPDPAPTATTKLPVTDGVVVMRPMLSLNGEVNHRLPSGPGAIDDVYSKAGNKDAYSVTTPVDGTTFPKPVLISENHMFPSGPAAIAVKPTCVRAYSVSAPEVVILATWPNSMSQRFPSGPAVILAGKSEVG